VHQTYWAHFGTWSPQAWRLSFVVSAQGEPVGVAELEGNDFPALRTVESSSYLVAPARGAGLGQQMRRAVLALTFGPLEAGAATTSAWHDNHASLGVCRALGYRSNGEQTHRRGAGVDTMVHLRLARSDWLASSLGEDVTITGFEPCRPLFEL
jgi:RimJ/RimL family protein N-acetyltransferase